MTIITRSLTRPQPYLFCATLQKIAHDNGIFSFHDLLMIASTNKANRRELLSQWNWQVFILKRLLYIKALKCNSKIDYCRIRFQIYNQEASFYKSAVVAAKLIAIDLAITYSYGIKEELLKLLRNEIMENPKRFALDAIQPFVESLEVFSNPIIISYLGNSAFPDAEFIQTQLLEELPPGSRVDASVKLAKQEVKKNTPEGNAKAIHHLSNIVIQADSSPSVICDLAVVQSRTNENDSIKKALEVIALLPPYETLDALIKIAITCVAKNQIDRAYSIARHASPEFGDCIKLCIDIATQPVQSRSLLTLAYKAIRTHNMLALKYYIKRRLTYPDPQAIKDVQMITRSLDRSYSYHEKWIANARSALADQRSFSSALTKTRFGATIQMVVTRLEKQSNAIGLRKAIELSESNSIISIDSFLTLADRCTKEHLPHFEDPLSVVRDLINLVSADTPPPRRTRHFDLIPSYEESDASIHIQKRRRVKK